MISRSNFKTLPGSCLKSILIIILAVGFSVEASAQVQAIPVETPVYYKPLFVMLSIIIVLLLMAIVGLAELVKAAAHRKKESEREKKSNSGMTKILLLILAIGSISGPLQAQEVVVATAPVVEGGYWGVDYFTFYFMVSVIAFEVWVAWGLYTTAMQLINEGKKQKALVKVQVPSFVEKINASVAIENEKDIMLDHNYDGIQELDNDLPPWWKYGFYLTIVFAVIYMVYYHSGKDKLQLAEYEAQMLAGQQEMEEYRKKAANLVDENNATVLTDDASISSGQTIYKANCAACHGGAGEGGVGPNLTDDYWMHKGGIKDVFLSIKQGWPEKGMKSWQQDLGAKQIHEVASYIKSLRGTNPSNPKEKQGELCLEEVKSDSVKVIGVDSTQMVVREN